MSLSRTSISMSAALFHAAKQRQTDRGKSSFSDYIQDLIQEDLAAAHARYQIRAAELHALGLPATLNEHKTPYRTATEINSAEVLDAIDTAESLAEKTAPQPPVRRPKT